MQLWWSFVVIVHSEMKSAHSVWSKKHIKSHYMHSQFLISPAWYQRLAPSLTSWIGSGRPDLDPQAFWYQGPTPHRWADTPNSIHTLMLAEPPRPAVPTVWPSALSGCDHLVALQSHQLRSPRWPPFKQEDHPYSVDIKWANVPVRGWAHSSFPMMWDIIISHSNFQLWI